MLLPYPPSLQLAAGLAPARPMSYLTGVDVPPSEPVAQPVDGHTP